MTVQSPPAGTVTFLFTDIEGSTWLLQHLGEDYDGVLHAHNGLLREVWSSHKGYEVSTEGDAFFVTFGDANDAVRAALAAQLALTRHQWPDGAAVRVRIGIHTGEARVYGKDYVGLAVHQAARIASAAHGGQVIVSDEARAAARGVPSDVTFTDLGAHRLKDLSQPVRLFQLAHPGLGGDFPPPRTLTVMPNNFPLQVTSFVGRDDDTVGIRHALSESRLVTLTGAGGVGKTRLAMQVGAELLDNFGDGAWLVDLAPLADPMLVVGAVGDVLGVREQAGRELSQTLVDALVGKELLIVLDNCEHLIEACAQLTHQLLTACPKVKVLATSREALAVAGETVWRLRSLEVPERSEDIASLARAEAVRLFVQRARAARPDFDLTPENADAIVQVCRRLDGLPLAIELAAARVRSMSVHDIAARLDDRFRLLTGGARMALPRQRTLEATVSWSYGLLSDSEKLLFDRLSVFAGGCTLGAAEAVCAGSGIDELEVADLIGQLVDRSLLIADHGAEGPTRYRMLETLRQFGRERLMERGEVLATRDRHLAWALTVAERPSPVFDRLAWIDDPEEDNLYVAIEWASETGNVTAALRIATSAWFGHYDQRARWFDELLPRSEEVPRDLYAMALRTAGGLDFMRGTWEKGQERMSLGAAVYDEVGDEVGSSWCRVYEAVCVGALGDSERSRRMLETTLRRVRELDDHGPHARTLLALSWLWTEIDVAKADELATEGEQVSLGLEALFDRAHAWEVLGYVRCLQNRYTEAGELLTKALRTLEEAKIPTCGAHCLEVSAAWAVMTGRLELGAELVGAAARIREETGDVPRPWERVVHELWLPKIAEELTPDAYESARHRGSRMSFSEAVAVAERELVAVVG